MTFKFYHHHSILVLLIWLFTNVSQGQDLLFENYTVEDGLPMNTVLDITQDSQGFMWFATDQGLARFDGIDFRTFKPISGNPESIRSLNVTKLLAGKNGRLWIGFFNGIDSYDTQTGIFHHLDFDKSVFGLKEDAYGGLWISTPDDGIFRFDPLDSTFTQYRYDPNNQNSLTGNFVKSDVYIDTDGMIWIGAGDSTIQALNPKTGIFKNHPLQGIVRTIHEDQKNNLWICLEVGALVLLDKNDGLTKYYFRDPNDYTNSPNMNWFNQLFEDSKGDLWISTGRQGLFLFDPVEENHLTYKHNPEDEYSLSSNTINDLFEDRAGNLWIATYRGGINFLRAHKHPFRSYKHHPEDPNSLIGNGISSFFERPNGDMWIGTESGLDLFNPQQGTFQHFHSYPAGHVLEDSNGNVWFGGLGKFRYPDINNLDRFDFFWVHALFEDSNGTIWVGHNRGLTQYQPQHNQFKTLESKDTMVNILQRNAVVHFYEEDESNFWVSTMGGLYVLDVESDKIVQFDNKATFAIIPDPLGNLIIAQAEELFVIDKNRKRIPLNLRDEYSPSGLLADEKGNYWFSTRSGDIVRFDQNTREFLEFDDADGIRENEFSYRAQFKASTGELYFGGEDGFVFFHPDSIKDNPYIPPVVITNFLIFNQEAPIAGSVTDTLGWDSPLTESITSIEQIKLPYHLNVFTLEFASLNYSTPERNLYKYKMEGFNKDWISTDADNRLATFTNLSPGKYNFMVMASNDSGVWNEDPATLSIIILPPWWLTLGAKIGYVLIFIGAVWGFIYQRTQKHKRKLKEMQQINDAFSKFVPYEFLHAIGREFIMDVQLGDKTYRDVTVLFLDIRNYTTMAESMTPDDNFAFIQKFVGLMGPVIVQNNGFINQYLGDGIMAIFPENVDDALKAAIDLQKEVAGYNQTRIASGKEEIRVGIGLHSGPLIMGIIGDEKRSDPATIADSVNTASRLEGMTKLFGVKILISEESLQLLEFRENYRTRYMGEVLVKGKTIPVQVYECFDSDEDNQKVKKIETLNQFADAMDLFHAKNFSEASVIFKDILEINPEDKTTQYFYNRSIEFAEQGVPEDWTGVEKLDRK